MEEIQKFPTPQRYQDAFIEFQGKKSLLLPVTNLKRPEILWRVFIQDELRVFQLPNVLFALTENILNNKIIRKFLYQRKMICHFDTRNFVEKKVALFVVLNVFCDLCTLFS